MSSRQTTARVRDQVERAVGEPLDGPPADAPEPDPALLRRPQVSLAEAQHVARQMIAVADRLCGEFAPTGGAAAESVREQVRKAWADFGSPRVIAYLPVLVERTVRGRLVAVPHG